MEDLLQDNGFDFEKFKLENEHSAKNILLAMQAYADQEALRFGYYLTDGVISVKRLFANYTEFLEKTAQK